MKSKLITKIVLQIGFAGTYALLFGFVSGLAGFLFVPEDSGEGWEFLWIYTGVSGFISALILSKYFIEKKRNYKGSRLVTISIFVALLAH